MDFDPDTLKQQIPFYLTASDKDELLANLKTLAAGGPVEYFLSAYHDPYLTEVLQGDGWRGLELFLFETGEKLTVRGIVLSNSCDISPDNDRQVQTNTVFAPLAKLSVFRELLLRSGIGEERVTAKISAIKAQKTSNVLYLPAGGPLAEDYIVRLDDVHSMPTAAHRAQKEREKLFTLSQTGFYLFVFKLSVHFCRLQENVLRRASAS